MNSVNHPDKTDFTFHKEQIHPKAMIARSVIILGQVDIEEEVNIWFQSVIRGDTEKIHIQAGTNVQEGCIIHADPGFPVAIGAKCTLGHGAVVHGAQIGAGCIIGIRATILNGVKIGANSLVAAGSLLPPGKSYPANSFIIGSPATVRRDLSRIEIAKNIEIAERYIQKARQLGPEYRIF